MANLSYEDRTSVDKYLLLYPQNILSIIQARLFLGPGEEVEPTPPDVQYGNAIAGFYNYSFKTNFDEDNFFNDGFIKLSWDTDGKDLEVYMLKEPQGTGDLVSLAAKGDSGVVSTYITEPNYKYDVYPAGVNATEGLVVWISAEDDSTYPSYKIFLHNAGTSYNSIVEIKKIIPKPI